MKGKTAVIIILAFSALLAGYLLSSISFVGRVGIGLFYQQYKFLKIWWLSALIVFGVWMFIGALQVLLRKKLPTTSAKLIYSVSILIAFAGLYFSYSDFRHSLSHRWLGERFHLGVYLFWIGWIGISIYSWINFSKVEEEKQAKEI